MAEYTRQQAESLLNLFELQYGSPYSNKSERDSIVTEILDYINDGPEPTNGTITLFLQNVDTDILSASFQAELVGPGIVGKLGAFITNSITWLMTSLARVFGIQLADIGHKVFRRAIDDIDGYNFGPLNTMFDRMVADGYMDRESAGNILAGMPKSKRYGLCFQ